MGALVLVLLARWRQPGWHSLLATLTALAAGLLWYRLRGAPDLPVLEQPWEVMVLPAATLVWRLDGWAWLCGLLAILVTVFEILFNWDSAGWSTPRVHSRRLLALAAALAVVASNNLLTLASMWMLFECALLARHATRPQQSVTVADALGGLLIWLAISLTSLELAQLPLGAGALTSLPLLLLLLTGLWRVAAYPFHPWLLADTSSSRPARLAEFLLPMTAGLALLGRLHQAGLAAQMQQPVWLAIGLAGLLGSSLAAWLDPNQERSLLLVAVNRIVWCMTAMVLSPTVSQAAAAWPALTLTLGLSGLLIGQAIARTSGWCGPLALSMLALIGLPGMIGLPIRTILATLPTMQDALLPGLDTVRWLLTLLADSIAVAAILRHWPAAVRIGSPNDLLAQRWPIVRQLAGFVLFAAPLLTLGLRPDLLAGWLGLMEQNQLVEPLWAQIQRLSVWMWAIQAAAIGAGFLLARWRSRLLAAQITRQRIITQVVSLDWLLAGLRAAGRGVAAFTAQLAGLLDGAGYVGWLALVVLIAFLLQTGT